MPSKGIMVYSFVGDVPDCTVSFSVPAQTEVVRGPDHNFTEHHLEIESSNLPGLFHFTGRFQWSVSHQGRVLATRYNDINALTGNIEQGDMKSIKETQSLTFPEDNIIITYGFYDAGSGKFGLPDKDHCYVTVTRLLSGWQGEVAPPGSIQAQKPFSRFALAAPHDPGMNQMQIIEHVLTTLGPENVGWLIQMYPRFKEFRVLMPVADNLFLDHLPEIIYTLAMTQKDKISTMLNLGARYFEFRPAHLLPFFHAKAKLPDVLYFHHSFFPGVPYSVFLQEIVEFLDANPTEHVVIHIRYDNIPVKSELSEGCKRPDAAELTEYMSAALSEARTDPRLRCGDIKDLQKPIDQLRAEGTRIILVTEAAKYDSYSAIANQTLSANSILTAFNNMTTEGQQSTELTMLQCQATSQALPGVAAYSVIAANASTSCLMSTKAALDMQTLPWIRDNAFERLKGERLVVVLNDFIDGATTSIVKELSMKRLNE